MNIMNQLSTLVFITFAIGATLETLEGSKLLNHIFKRQTNICDFIQCQNNGVYTIIKFI